MKKVVGSVLMTGAMLLGSVVPVLVSAADSTTPSTPVTENRTGSTSTNASFTANSSAMNPVDPSDPNQPTTDPGSNAGKPGGGLSLIYAPMTIDFGTHQINVMNAESYNAKGEAATLAKGAAPIFTADPVGKATWSTDTTVTGNQTTLYPGTANVVLEVSDVRGTNAGWTLGLSSAGGTLSSVKGATITLPQGTVTSSGAVMSGSTTAKAPNGATSTANTINVDGGTATVLGAAVNAGAGISTDSLNPAAIMLNVAANSASKGNFTGALNWTLSDTALTNN